MTKVLPKVRGLRLGHLAALAILLTTAFAQAQSASAKLAEAMYLRLGQVGLDPQRVYQVRGASLDRSSVHISLEDGTIAFTQDVEGRITGAFFEGYGEVLLTPPNDVERRSMSLFTGMAILEEHFETAYFRFNDNAAGQLRPDLRESENGQAFVDHWGATAQNLAELDAMRLLMSFSRLLPARGKTASAGIPANDHFLHARLQGVIHGVFDVYYDSLSTEQVQAGQTKTGEDGETYYDVWTSFSPAAAERPHRGAEETPHKAVPAPEDWLDIHRYTITTEVEPPKLIHAQAQLQVEIRRGGPRMILFELSRFLEVESVKLDGEAVEFIHNPSVEGTQLARKGNDFLAVILPDPAEAGQKFDLGFKYEGDVLAAAGSGLLYVGERGTWYPNRGLIMANFDLQFSYPPGWTLVATGKQVSSTPDAEAKEKGLETSHWVSERPMPVAGFNLGKYKLARTQAGNVTVETFATAAVERDFPTPPIHAIEIVPPGKPLQQPPRVIVPSRPSPTQNEESVGQSAAQAIEFYAQRFGPYPYGQLALTQMPGRDSQGWPGLVFLSSYAFLNDQDRQELHISPEQMLLQHTIPAHETAHQWWGDLVVWQSYRDQWLSEGLANYCALMMLQQKNPEGFRRIMERYRDDLLRQNKDGMAPKDAGPVTLGYRLLSSRFPEGYEAITYGRSTWLFHMLRTMLDDAESKGDAPDGADEPFVRVLRRVREEYQGKSISTQELLDAFAHDLPLSLRYEGKESLDWFLDGWINGTSLPTLELTSVKFAAKGARSLVSGTIVQKDAPSDLVTSVPVYAVLAGKRLELLGRVFADGEESSFRIVAPAGTRKIVLDPYETILTSPKK